MLQALKQAVCQANLDLVREGLVIQTFGNVSGIDRSSGRVVIKPSGVSYDGMTADQMVVVDLKSGKVVEGDLRPSSDTPTHLVLYRAFEDIGGIVHTHSLYATAWAQAKMAIPALGTTHADYWQGEVPCTRVMTAGEIAGDYEAETGAVIVEAFAGIAPLHKPGVLVASHGPFAWGRDTGEAVHHAAILEYLAKLAGETLRLNPAAGPMGEALLEKHFSRKHGAKAYYGQDRSASRKV